MNILCRLAGHKWRYESTFIPSIEAEIVTEYKHEGTCRRCHKHEVFVHERWDPGPEEFYPAGHRARADEK